MSPTESRQRSRSLSDLRLPNTSNDISPVLEAMKTEMAEMKKNIQKMKEENTREKAALVSEVKDLKGEIKLLRQVIDLKREFALSEIREELKTLQEYVDNELDELNESLTDKIRVIEDALDDLEREMKECELEIEELYKLQGENLIKAVIRIGQEINCRLEASDIKSCYRKPSKIRGKLGNVVVKFNQLDKRNNFLRSYNANADNTDVCVEVPLTSRSQNLLSMIYRNNNYGYYDVFTENGKLYVQEDMNGEVICVKSEDDLP